MFYGGKISCMFIILKNIAYQKSLFSKSHEDDGRKKSSRYKERATGDLLQNYFGSYILVFSIYLCQKTNGWVGE